MTIEQFVDFLCVDTIWGKRWVTEDRTKWIVFYDELKTQNKPCYYAYKTIVPCKDKDPWCVNNIRIGKFDTLKETMDYLRENEK